MAENNHQRTLALRAPRGVLFDRHGQVLVQNREALNISLVREQARNIDQSVRMLAAVTGVEERSVRDVVERNRNLPRYRPLMIVHDASLNQVAAVAARKHELPRRDGRADADARVSRGRARRAPVRLRRRDHRSAARAGPSIRGSRPGSMIGQAGVEQTYNKLLMGRDGARVVTVNSVGPRDQRDKATHVKPIEGQRLQLTIDYDIQKAAQDGFEATGYQGSAVMLDPRNGEILSLVSRAGLRSQRLRRRHRRAAPGAACSPTSCCRCRTAPFRAAIRRDRCSRSRSPSPGSRRA